MLEQPATAVGTAAYASRFPSFPGNYRPLSGNLSVSSLGIGTYLGQEDSVTDQAYGEALCAALLGGINLVDTAVNYRCQRSERVIGKILAELVHDHQIRRDEIVVATKGGYTAFDDGYPPDPQAWFDQKYVHTGIVKPSEVVHGWQHCISPAYLEALLETSRRNLGLNIIDIYYVHNPEAQLGAVTREEFGARIRKAFEFLEDAVKTGKIGAYGTATWNGFRLSPTSRDYLSLAELVAAATDAGGRDHHFKVIQFPYNLAMTEALTAQNQAQPGGASGSLLAAADSMEIAVCASASLLQGQLTSRLPDILRTAFPDMESDAQRSIQFVRSTPRVNVALVGMSSAAHVTQNLAALKHPPASFDALMKLFKRADG